MSSSFSFLYTEDNQKLVCICDSRENVSYWHLSVYVKQ